MVTGKCAETPPDCAINPQEPKKPWHGEVSRIALPDALAVATVNGTGCFLAGRADRQRDITAGWEASNAERDFVSGSNGVGVEPDGRSIDQTKIVEGVVVANIGLDVARTGRKARGDR